MTLPGLRFASGMARLKAHCEERILTLEQAEESLLQRLEKLFDVRCWDTYTNAYLINPGAGRVKRVGSIGAGIGLSARVSAIKRRWDIPWASSTQRFLLSSAISA